MSLLEKVKYNLDEISSRVAKLDVANHAQVGDEWVTVADMADPAIARNNCWATSNEIYESGHIENIVHVEEVDIVGVESPGCTHYAVYLTDGEEEVVMDFTVRQFSPDAPFPYVVPLTTWHAYMKHITGLDMALSVGD